ncbi:MAG: hypothetical protein ACREJ6_07890, partial [Candidatus Methylomirabilis sp.]
SGRHDIAITDPSNGLPEAINALDLVITEPESIEMRGFAPVASFPMRMSLWSWVPEKFRNQRDHDIAIWRRVDS